MRPGFADRVRPFVPGAAIFALALAVRLVAAAIVADDGLHFVKYWELGSELRQSSFVADRPFSYAPIYCYFVGFAQVVLGVSFGRVLMLQAAIGALNCALLFLVARRLLGPRWALLPGAVACFYHSFVVYDVAFLSDALGLSFQLGLLLVLDRVDTPPGARRAGLAGLLLGLAALHRANNLLLLPLLLAAWSLSRPPLRRLVRDAAVLGGAALLTTLPIVVQNLHLTGSAGITASNPGYIFYSSNNAASFGFRYSPPELYYRANDYYQRLGATGSELPFLGDAEIAAIVSGAILGRPMSLDESSRYYLRFTLDHVRRYPRYYLGLELRKLQLAFHGYESHDVAPVFSSARALSGIAPVRFGWIAPLGILGLAASLRAWRRTLALWILLVNNLALLVLFYVVVRFRLPIEAVLLLASGLAATMLAQWFRNRDVPRLLGAAAGLAVLYVGCNTLPEDLEERARYRELEQRLEEASRLAGRGEIDRAATLLEQLLREDREDLPRAITAHRLLAQIRARSGSIGGSTAMREPAYFEPQAVLGRLHLKWEQGRITFAELQYLAFLLRSSGDPAAAADVLRAALARRPEPLARYELAALEAQAGRGDSAGHLLRAAMQDGLMFTTRGIHGALLLARVLDAAGDTTDARRWVVQASRLSALAPWYPDEVERRSMLDRLRATPGYEAPPRLDELAAGPGVRTDRPGRDARGARRPGA